MTNTKSLSPWQIAVLETAVRRFVTYALNNEDYSDVACEQIKELHSTIAGAQSIYVKDWKRIDDTEARAFVKQLAQ